MFADFHLHTAFSEDSEYPMEEAVQDAIALGMQEICFTDHVDYGVLEDVDYKKPRCPYTGKARLNVDYPCYFETIETLQKKYGDRITIRKGLELGVQSCTLKENQALVDRYPMDFVILSIHQIDNQEFWNQQYQSGKSQREINRGYYKELLSVIQSFKSYSVLGHLDLIRRYDPYGEYPFEEVRDLVTEILKTVIADGKGIEINLSSTRYGLDDSMPSAKILALYHELGGRIITIGSDSHEKAHLDEVPARFMEACSRLRLAGFTEFCTFENGVPHLHPLPQLLEIESQ